MDKIVVLYTMKNCPFCHELKEMLDKENIEYYDRDINEYKDEYDIFVEITKNEYVPSFMTIESPESEKPKVSLFAPERDFDELEDGVKIIKEFLEN
jgi:glutaredoxin